MSKRVKRALICSPVMPEYDREGGSRRIFHFLEYLKAAGWAVSFLAQNASGGQRYARAVRQLGVATYAGYDTRLASDEYLPNLERLITYGNFDLAIFVFWDIGERYLPLFRALSPSTKLVVDSIDLHFLRNARRVFGQDGASGVSRTLDNNYAEELRRELNTYAAADLVLTVSQKEADLINDFVGNPELAKPVPLMEDLPFSTVPFEERKGILFLGNFRHPPNVQAVEYLCQDILPLVDKKLRIEHPVYIVGNALDHKVMAFGADLPEVCMVGWVPSVLPYLQKVRLSVVPLRYGAGTKTKLIQALTVGTPSVSTRFGIEGLNLTEGENVLVADDAATFAEGITRLLEDRALWQRLSIQGCQHIQSMHGREAVKDRLMEILDNLVT